MHFTEGKETDQLTSLDVINRIDKLESEPFLEECKRVSKDNLMEMLTFCVLTTYFQFASDLY